MVRKRSPWKNAGLTVTFGSAEDAPSPITSAVAKSARMPEKIQAV
jgi:hypothetical protein